MSGGGGLKERVLGVDYGRRRIGVAATDALWIAAHPVGAIDVEKEDPLEALAALCTEREIERIVVGLPLHAHGGESEMSREVRAFAAKLGARTGLPIEFVDERLTSHAAEEALRGRSPARRRKEKGRVDAVAAAALLRDWMARASG